MQWKKVSEITRDLGGTLLSVDELEALIEKARVFYPRKPLFIEVKTFGEEVTVDLVAMEKAE